MKVIIAGPPHSGKSVFIYGLCKLLGRGSYFLFRACPDGEGSWTYRDEANAKLRYKGTFDRPFMDYVLSGLKNVDVSVPLTLVDVGGVRSPENEKIFRACDGFIVLSSSEDEMVKWQEFGQNAGLTCLALLRSDLHGKHTLESSDLPVCGIVAGLERGQLVISPCHEALAKILCGLTAAERKGTPMITTTELAERLVKTPVERALPNGKVVKQLVWEGEDLPRLQETVFGPLAAQLPAEGRYILDGPAPAWLSVAFAHGVHPQCAALNDPRLGAVDVRAPKPSGNGEGNKLQFSVKEADEFTFVEFEIVGGVFDVDDLDSVRGPVVNPRKGVVLSGRGPNWLTATLAMGYHLTRWVACWQPGFGAIVCMSHHPERKLGELVEDRTVRAAREA